jgi:hypothetical protein
VPIFNNSFHPAVCKVRAKIDILAGLCSLYPEIYVFFVEGKFFNDI